MPEIRITTIQKEILMDIGAVGKQWIWVELSNLTTLSRAPDAA